MCALAVCLMKLVITLNEIPRERSCDISENGHSIPSGVWAMKPAGSFKVECKVKWLKNELFQVVIEGAVTTMRHHNPDRLRAALASPRVTKFEIHPKYELLRIHLKDGGIPLRFYMTSGQLEPCALGSYVWTVRKRKLSDDQLEYWE